jgi:hypothetical protein
MSGSRRLIVLAAALGAVALVGWGATIVAIATRPQSSGRRGPRLITGQISYDTSGQRRRVSPIQRAVVLHRLSYASQEGGVTIGWYDSDFESLMKHGIGLVSLLIDHKRVASTAKTSLTGTYEDGQGDLVWRGRVAAGQHTIEVEIEGTAPWGVPYTDPGRPGIDELIIDGRARQ